MSSLELKIVQPDGEVVGDHDLSNSWGGAVRIWDAIFERHYHPKPVRYGRVVEYALGLEGAERERFWTLAHDTAIPRFARRVYAWTFDRIVLPREECEQTAADLHTFDRSYPPPSGAVNHLPALADYLRAIAKREDVRAVAVNWTSVSNAWPGVLLNPDDPELEDYRRPNIGTDNGWRFLSAIVPATDEAP